MPQMAPLNWLSLFLMFSITFLIFNSINYYMFNYPIKFYNKGSTKNKMNWKW